MPFYGISLPLAVPWILLFQTWPITADNKGKRIADVGNNSTMKSVKVCFEDIKIIFINKQTW